MLADHIPKIDGLDSSNGMVEQFNKKAAARNVSDRIHAFYMDLTESGQLKDTYDVIFSNLAFHHVEDIAKMSRLLGERLNPGGLFIAVDFSKTDFSVLFHPPGTFPTI
jgi:2-polyprenyl-3-methyl-5-hydroxy-6-metoxy-1,4-benzoquinol methylase